MPEETQQWPKVMISDVRDLGESCWGLAQTPVHPWIRIRRTSHHYKQDWGQYDDSTPCFNCISHARWTSWNLVSLSSSFEGIYKLVIRWTCYSYRKYIYKYTQFCCKCTSFKAIKSIIYIHTHIYTHIYTYIYIYIHILRINNAD